MWDGDTTIALCVIGAMVMFVLAFFEWRRNEEGAQRQAGRYAFYGVAWSVAAVALLFYQ